jgi:TonB family protein
MTLRCLSLGAFLAVVPLSAAMAQEARPCPAPRGAVLLSCHVDVPPVPALDRKLPRYPEILRQAGIEGEVHIRYVVDTSGHVAPGTLMIVASKYDLFSTTVKAAAPEWRFVPAVRSGARIAVLREELFVFRDTPGGPPDNDVEAVRDTTTEGMPRTAIGPARRDSMAARAYSPEDLMDAQLSVLLVLAARMPSGEKSARAPTLCVSLMRDGVEAPADAEATRRLEAPGQRVVAKRDCPPSYDRMIVSSDSLGRVVDPRPPGYVDPYHLSVRRVEPWSRVLVLIHADVGHGLSGTNYRCGARRESGMWSATCHATSAWVH